MSSNQQETAFLNEFCNFLQRFDVPDEIDQGHASPFYIRALHEMSEMEETTLFIDFDHVMLHSEPLAESIHTQFYRFERSMRRGVYQLMLAEKPSFAEHYGEDMFAVGFYNLKELNKIRDLRSSKLGQLCAISGTVTRTSEARPELVVAKFTCMECQTDADAVEQQFRFTEPVICKNPECSNSSKWQLRSEDSVFVDWQRLRVQEDSGDIPAGSMPRTIDVILRNSIVERAKAGDKCVFVGTLVVVPDLANLTTPGERVKGMSQRGAQRQQQSGGGEGVTGLKALGVRDMTYRTCFLANNLEPLSDQIGGVNVRDDNEEELVMSDEEKADIKAMYESGGIYNRLSRSVCPHVFGHDDIKRGVLLMLMGGVHKEVDEGMHLRGDINICVVGDPSTAKSQFLKYIKDFLPRAVYTSGKASSAAGLTASVIRDNETGEFAIEAGALMLADNGICCIDEFDKMDVKDQVAIHEAMEQQTISISKAGVQATLNARTSVLAAANPIEGRYDKSRSLKANINMSAPIMSRFDLFFVIIDECDEVYDFNLARHIVGMHKQPDQHNSDADFEKVRLQRYIRFARTLKPKITPEAAELLVGSYSKLRQGDAVGAQRSSYRITVRQLESMVRLSEALARVHLSERVLPQHVQEAYRLLQRSIIRIESNDIDLQEDVMGDLNDSDDDDEEGGDVRMDHKKTRKDEGEGEGEGEGAKAKAGKAAAAPKPLSITFERYQQITHSLVHHIRKEGGDGDEAEGVVQKDVVEWFLSQQDIATEQELVEQGRLIRNLIGRLVKRDFVLMAVEPEAVAGQHHPTPDDRVLFANPNFNIDGN